MKKVTCLIFFALLTATSLFAAQNLETQKLYAPATVQPQQLNHWENFNRQFNNRWRVDWNPRTGSPRVITGHFIKLLEPARKDNVESAMRDLLSRYRQVLQVEPEDLLLSNVDFQESINPQWSAGTWYVSFKQTYKGLPVEGGSVRMMIRDNRVTQITSDFFPGIDLPTKPLFTEKQAFETIKAFSTEMPLSSELIVYPKAGDKAVKYHLAWDFVMPLERAPKEVLVQEDSHLSLKLLRKKNKRKHKDDGELIPVRWRYLVDALTGKLIDRINLLHYQDLSGQVTGMIVPEKPSDSPIQMPISHLTVRLTQDSITTSTETDTAGNYAFSGLVAGPADLEAHLEGPRIRVWNSKTTDPDATHATALTLPTTHDWNWSLDDPSPNDVETTAFYHVNFIRDWFLRGGAFNVDGVPDLGQLDVYVRAGKICNASADGRYPMLDFGSGIPGQCEDFALCADTIYHEYTHLIEYKVSADLPKNMKEAWSDYFGATITGDPHSTSGCWSDLWYVRNLDSPDKRFPDDYLGNEYMQGLIFSGALWDLRSTPSLSVDYVDRLVMQALKQAPSSFSENLGAMLAWDDDPGFSTDPALADYDTANGTPNIDSICHNFYDVHGIFHPDCTGHTQQPVAFILSPVPQISFDNTVPLDIVGSALGSATASLINFTIEWASADAPNNWRTNGVTLVGGGTSPVSSNLLAQLDISSLPEIGDGRFRIRLTVTVDGDTASIITTLCHNDCFTDPVAEITSPTPSAVQVYDGSTPVDIIGSAHGSPADPLDHFIIRWQQRERDYYGSAGAELVDGGTSPIYDDSLAQLHLSGLHDGVAEIKLEVRNIWREQRFAGTEIFITRDALPGWPIDLQGDSYGSPVVADLDPDYAGLEIATLGSQLYVFHADGTLYWQAFASRDPAVGDLDGDGSLEIVVADHGTLKIHRQNGSEAYRWPDLLPAYSNFKAPALGDLDGDGDLEIVVAATDNKVYALHHDGPAVTGWPHLATTSTAIGDLDGDGRNEVVFASTDGKVHVRVGDGTNFDTTFWPKTIGSWIQLAPALGDLDGDGDLEIVVGTYEDEIHALHHDGSNVTGWPITLTGSQKASASLGDVDGDGRPEVVLATWAPEEGNVYMLDGNGNILAGWPKLLQEMLFEDPTDTEVLLEGITATSAALGDVDSDGDLEVLVGTENGYAYAWHHNGELVVDWPKDVFGNASQPVIADIDRNGDVEILLGANGFFIWDLPAAYNAASQDWPLSRHNNWRTGTYGPKAGVALVLDTSGSMSWRGDGSRPAPLEEQRISFAKEAAKPFLELLNAYNAHKANFSIATFPSHPSSPGCDAEVVTALRRINDNTKETANNITIPGLTTENGTPLLAGVRKAATMFGPESSRAMILLSDGYHNCPGYVGVGDPAVTELVELLQRNSIRVFTISFGMPGDTDIELLAHLAEATKPADFVGSQFHDVTTLSFEPDTWDPWDRENTPFLNAIYKDILIDALNLQAAVDPLGVIAAGETTGQEVRINEHDQQVSFYLSWRTAQEDRLSLTIRDSSGNPVSPSASGVDLVGGETYRVLTVNRDYLTQPGKVGPTPWRIEISSQGGASGKTEPFQYSVIMDSDLKLQPGLERRSYAAGDTIKLTAKLSEAGQPLTGLSDVQVMISAPEDGKGNWLSIHPVSAEELARVPETKGSEHLMPFMRKSIYLSEIAQIDYPSQLSPQTLPLYDDASHGDITANDGIYTNRFTDTDKEGVYTFRFLAQGTTQAGNGFERERQLQKYLIVRADTEATRIDATLLQMGDFKRYQVRTIPKDTQGNFVGPGHTGVIHFAAKRAKFVGELQDNLDGSYAQTLQVPLDTDEKDVHITVDVQQNSTSFNLADKLGKDFGYSLHLGRTSPTGNFGQLYDADINLGLDIEVPLQERLSAVAALQYSNFKASKSGLSDTYWWSLSGSVKYQFSAQPLQPYISGGAGLYRPESGSTEPGVLLGLGVDYELNPQWSAEVGADYHNIFTSGDDTEFWVIRAGLIYRP